MHAVTSVLAWLSADALSPCRSRLSTLPLF
jgi:hypothetical protein